MFAPVSQYLHRPRDRLLLQRRVTTPGHHHGCGLLARLGESSGFVGSYQQSVPFMPIRMRESPRLSGVSETCWPVLLALYGLAQSQSPRVTGRTWEKDSSQLCVVFVLASNYAFATIPLLGHRLELVEPLRCVLMMPVALPGHRATRKPPS